MIFSNYSTFVALLLLSSSLNQVVVQVVQAQNWNGRDTPVTCSICRDANRPILNPTHSFTMSNENTWTCDYLQETVQDVDANASYEEERLMCEQAQLAGETGGCECGGEAATIAAPTTQDEVPLLNQNPPCDICAGQASPVVPSSNYDITVTTEEVGVQNCKGLYDSMQGGILDSSSCSRVQQEAGSTCCSTTISSGSSSSGFSPTSTTSNNNSNDSNISDDNNSSVLVPVTPSTAVPEISAPIVVPVPTPSPVAPGTSAPVVSAVTPFPVVPETSSAAEVPVVTPSTVVPGTSKPVVPSAPVLPCATASNNPSNTTSFATTIPSTNPQLSQFNTASANGSGNARAKIGKHSGGHAPKKEKSSSSKSQSSNKKPSSSKTKTKNKIGNLKNDKSKSNSSKSENSKSTDSTKSESKSSKSENSSKSTESTRSSNSSKSEKSSKSTESTRSGTIRGTVFTEPLP